MSISNHGHKEVALLSYVNSRITGEDSHLAQTFQIVYIVVAGLYYYNYNVLITQRNAEEK